MRSVRHLDHSWTLQWIDKMPYIGIDFGTSNSVVANFQYGQADVLYESSLIEPDPFPKGYQ